MTKVTKEHCLEIINKFEPCSENQKQAVLGIDGESMLIYFFKLQHLLCLEIS